MIWIDIWVAVEMDNLIIRRRNFLLLRGVPICVAVETDSLFIRGEKFSPIEGTACTVWLFFSPWFNASVFSFSPNIDLMICIIADLTHIIYAW